jgi:hypothetical protein
LEKTTFVFLLATAALLLVPAVAADPGAPDEREYTCVQYYPSQFPPVMVDPAGCLPPNFPPAFP